jgi:hypothetical protein
VGLRLYVFNPATYSVAKGGSKRAGSSLRMWALQHTSELRRTGCPLSKTLDEGAQATVHTIKPTRSPTGQRPFLQGRGG